MFDLNILIEKIPQLRPHKAKLRKIGVTTLQGLFCYLPRRHEDYSKIVRVAELKLNETATICGHIITIKNIFTRGRIILTEAIIGDKSGSIAAVWFNQPYLTKSLPVGSLVNLAGKPTMGKKGVYLANPVYERIFNQPFSKGEIKNIHTGRLVPVYPEIKGVSSRSFRHIIYPLLPLTDNAKDFMPLEIIKKEKLPSLLYALRQIHFPNSDESLKKARRRLAFDESFMIQLSALKQRNDWNKNYAAPIAFHEKITKKFVSKLTFKLTDAQRKAAWEIIKDLQKDKPMNRLLNGDVGSGKTIVATLAILQTCLNNRQTALMAPTEILAKQHYATLSELLEPFDIKCGLLCGSNNKKYLLNQIESGDIDLIIGTHALIQDKVKFKNLALVVIDEQHRFGVAQRAALQNKLSVIGYQLSADSKCVPHLLSMTATPIPRTLALTIYGDLDISILDEMPKNRQKIITQIIMSDASAMAYDFIRGEIKKGRQAFVVCPRIEEKITDNSAVNCELCENTKNLKSEIKSVKSEYKKLSEKIFPELKIEMMHGQLKSDKKEEILRDFRENKINILVSTSVIEVGIDMPNASMMIIEGAERFGLAQLHQFRGRIGRGEHQSYCLIFIPHYRDGAGLEKTESARLKALIKCQSGFELAEKDLEIRGAGELYGSKQWGISDLTANLLTDVKLIKSIRESIVWLVKNDPLLTKYPLLKEKLKELKAIQHFE